MTCSWRFGMIFVTVGDDVRDHEHFQKKKSKNCSWSRTSSRTVTNTSRIVTNTSRTITNIMSLFFSWCVRDDFRITSYHVRDHEPSRIYGGTVPILPQFVPFFLQVFRRFYNKKDAEILTNSKKLFSFSVITVVSQWVFELVRRKVEKMAWGPCLLCFHKADVALSHLMVSKKRLDTILAFSNSYGNKKCFFYFVLVFRRFYNKKDAEILTNSKNYFHFHSLQ